MRLSQLIRPNVQKMPFMAEGIGPLICNTSSRKHREMTVHHQGQITWSIKSLFGSVVVFQISFHAKMNVNDVFLFFKNYF